MITLLECFDKFRIRVKDSKYTWTYCKYNHNPTIAEIHNARRMLRDCVGKFDMWVEVDIGDRWILLPEIKPLLIGKK